MNRRQARKRLVEAIRSGDRAAVEALLDVRPDVVDAPNSHHNTPIGEAVGAGRLDLVALLAERGADPTRRNHGGASLLDGAAWAGQRAIADYLIAHGCEYTPHHAAALGDEIALADMLAHDAGIVTQTDRRGATPLHHAAHGDCAPCAGLLLAAGADVRAADRHRHEPLAYAVEAGAIGAARLLLDRGGDAGVPAGHYGGCVLHRALVSRSAAMVELLLERGADPNRQDSAGKTALHEAAVSGKRDLVELVLRHRPDLTLRTRRTHAQPGDETALDYARRRRKAAITAVIEAHARRGA